MTRYFGDARARSGERGAQVLRPACAGRAARASFAGLVSLSVATGCGVLVDTEPPVSVDQALASRTMVRDMSQDVFAVMADEDLHLVGASGSWGSCTDDGYLVQYEASASFTAAGHSADVLDDVRDAVAAETGWALTSERQSDSVTARGEKGGVRLSMRGYDDGPEVLVRLLGPCLAVPEDEQDSLDQGDIGAQDIEVPGVS